MYTTEVQAEKPEGSSLGRLTETIIVIAKTDLFSECLVQALRTRFFDCMVLACSEPERVRAAATSQNIRLVLVYDLSPGVLDRTVSVVEDLTAEAPLGVIVTASSGLDGHVRQLIGEGRINGILPLSHRLDIFLAAIDLMLKGGEHFPSSLMMKAETPGELPLSLPAIGRPLREDIPPGRAEMLGKLGRLTDVSVLTGREMQILELLCAGTQNKVIAARLNLSENTVKVHIRNIYKKMRVRNRTEAVSRFFSGEKGSLTH